MYSTRPRNMASLQYDRKRLSNLVLEPLQHFKLALGRKLTEEEMAQIKLHLNIQSDILVKVTDGEELIILLDQYYGLDIRVLERLLSEIECHDLLNVLLDWTESNYPAKSEVFYECSYVPLWIKIIADLPWFFENRKGIFRSLKILFQIPEIDSEDPDLDPLVFMGVSASERTTLCYVLLPVCMRGHVRMLIQDSDVSIALERLRICGIYFSRKVGSQGLDDLSVSPSTPSFADDCLADVHVDHNSNGPVSYTNSGMKPFIHMHNDAAQVGLHDSEQSRQCNHQTSEYGLERNDSRSGSAFVSQVRNQPQMMFSLRGYPSQPDEIFPPKDDIHVQASQPKTNSTLKEAAPLESKHASKGIINNMVKVRPQLTYINHDIYRVQAESGVEPACEDKTFARPTTPSETVVDESRDYIVEERVIANEPPKQCYSVNEPLFNEQSLADHKERPNRNQVEFQSKSSDSNGKSYVSKVVIPINLNNSQAKSCRGQVLNKNSSSEMRNEHLEDDPVRLIIGNPVSNSREPVLAQTREFSQIEQGPNWKRFPGNFEDSRKWYEVNEDTVAYNSQQMQPEPEQEMPHFQEASPRFQDENEYRIMQPEPEREFPNSNGDFDARRGWECSEVAERAEGHSEISPFESSEGELVKVRTQILHHQPQQASVFPPDDSVHSFDEGLNFNSSFLRPAPLTLPRVTPSPGRQSGGLFPPATMTRRTNKVPDNDARHGNPPMYVKYQDSQECHPRQPMNGSMKPDSELQSDYDDSVFTDTGSRSERDGPIFAPPPYNPPPDYKVAVKTIQPLLSVDGSTTSTETPERVSRSPLLSAESITSIYKEKERFLSREELNLSVRSAEEKEEERLTELCKDLLTAAKGGNEEEVKKHLDEGANIDYHNEFGNTASMIASREGHLEVVDVLVAAGADLNKQEWFGKSALHEAAWSGQHQVVHRLISAGANIDITDEERRTPLHYAAMRGKRRIAEVLLLFGADVSLLNKEGKSAVELAYSYEHDDIVAVLLSSQDKRMRREMEGRLRKEKLRTLRSAASLPNLTKATSIRELARSKSRSDLHGKKRLACVIQ